MQASNELLTIAELAIAIAGFSGVVVAFAHQGLLTTIDRYRFVGLLSLSVGAAVIAFVPSLLQLFRLVGSALWRGSSVVFLVFNVAFLIVLTPRRHISQAREVDAPRPLVLAISGLIVLTNVLQLSNALGWPWPPGPALLVLGLLAWLVNASIFFGRLVLARQLESSR